MTRLQSGIQVEVTPIKHELYIELGRNLSAMIETVCKTVIHTVNCEIEMTIKKDDVEVHVRAKG